MRLHFCLPVIFTSSIFRRQPALAEKDITEKMLEDYNDVFADIVNGLLFNGRQVIRENALTSGVDHSMYKADGKVHEQERDTAKFWKTGRGSVSVRLALIGIENQTEYDAEMPLRVIGYDGAAYRAVNGTRYHTGTIPVPYRFTFPRRHTRRRGFLPKSKRLSLILLVFKDYIKHFAWCNNKRFFRKMSNITGYKKSIILFPFFHYNFIKYKIFRIGQY